MSDPAPASPVPGLGWRRPVVAVGAVASVALGILGLGAIGSDDLFAQLDFVAATVAALSLVMSGAVLITRLPNHRVGWLLWTGGCLFAIADSNGSGGLGEFIGAGPGLLGWLNLVGDAAWVPAIICVAVMLPLVFPTGRLPSRRWRIVVAVGLVAGMFSIVQNVLTPFDPRSVPSGVTNPLAIGGTASDVASLLGDLSSLAGVVCLPLVAISLVLRSRHATGVERAQLKWLAAVVALVGPTLAIAIVSSVLPGDVTAFVSNLAFLATFIGLALLPVAIGIAVLRYRLYDIDVIIRRTVVYVPLTAILAGLYAASTALFQKAFILATGQRSDGAVIASTLILATLFTPIRGWLQGIVDRRFRDQLDAERQLDAFVDRVATAEWAPDPARTLRSFLAIAVAAVGASGGRAVIVDGTATRVVATAGRLETTAFVAEVAAAGGAGLGRIELGPKANGHDYRPNEVALVRDRAHHLAAAILGGDEPPAAEATPGPRAVGVRALRDAELLAEPGES